MSKSKVKKLISLILAFSMIFANIIFADNQPMYNITNNYYVIPGNGYNAYGGYNGGFGYQSFYYISGYDRVCDKFYNGEAMMSRVPIIAGGDNYLCYIANGITKPALLSIERWCYDNLNFDKIDAFYLNSSTIESQSPYRIVLLINCAFERKKVLDGHMEFRCYLDLINNRYTWERIGSNRNNGRYYDKDIHYYPY